WFRSIGGGRAGAFLWLGGLGLTLRRRCLVRRRSRTAVADLGDHRSDGRAFTLGDDDLAQLAGGVGLDLDVGLVALDLDERLVFLTDSITGAMSSGRRARMSTTSALIPSFSSSVAASMATISMRECAQIVMCSPGRFTSFLSSGTRCSPSGTSPLTAYVPSFSMNITGLSSRIADFNMPLASAGVPGATTFRPGTWANQFSWL